MGLSEFEKERLLVDSLVYEGAQHWLHYRHIEQERNQFLGFFFTLLVAIVGFFVAASSRIPSWPTVAIGLSAMAGVFGLISILIFTSIRKFGAALRVYDRDIARIRAALFAAAEDSRTHLVSPHHVKTIDTHPETAQRMIDPQLAAEIIIGTFAAAAFGVQLFVAVDALVTEAFSPGQRVLACGLTVVSIAGVSAGVRLRIRSGRLRRR